MVLSLRARLFLLFGGLVALLVGAEWYLARALTKELREESGVMALSLGSQVMSLFGTEVEDSGASQLTDLSNLESSFPTGAFMTDATVVVRGEADRLQFGSGEGRPHFLFAMTPPAGGVPGFVFQDDDSECDAIIAQAHQVQGAIAPPHMPEGMASESSQGVHLVQLALTGGTDVHIHKSISVGGEVRKGRRIRVSTQRSARTVSEVFPDSDELALELKFFHSDFESESPTGVKTIKTWSSSPNEPHPGAIIDMKMMARLDGGADEKDADALNATQTRIPIPVQGMRDSIDGFRSKLLAGSLGILLLGLAVAGWLAHRVAAPMRTLASAAEAVGEGQFGLQVEASSEPEIAATISAFNRMSSQLEELQEEASRLREREHLGELGEVARGLAHTLRNPLNVLGLTIEELARAPAQDLDDDATRDSSTESGREGLRIKARREVHRIDETLKSLLSLASSGGAPENTSMQDIARDVALELTQAGGRVRVGAPQGDIEMAVVPAEIRAVVHTLVVNAVEASPAGGLVEVTVLPSEAGARLIIEDTGPGLDPRVQERLFTPHVTTKPTGAGMGLYLAQRIVTNRYHGKLALGPREGGGTRATLDLGQRTEETRSPSSTRDNA